VAQGLGPGIGEEAAVLAVTSSGTEIVQAAGGVVWRRSEDGELEILLVHRPRYDDWTVPKGKLEPGETHAAAAVREVEEETGLRCELGAELASTSYEDRKGRPKQVRYWAMTATGGAFAPTDEVDEIRWLTLDEAGLILTYPRDVQLLGRLLQAV
jgi:8-oxo-dGTP pyrophosphatase MutT (NUDIX family)